MFVNPLSELTRLRRIVHAEATYSPTLAVFEGTQTGSDNGFEGGVGVLSAPMAAAVSSP